MSLRRRLLFTLGLSFCVLWVFAAAFLYNNLRDQVRSTLDQRLAASARMVAGLVAQLPEGAWNQAGAPILSMPERKGVACQISSPAGRVLIRTHGDFAGHLNTLHAGFTNRVINGQRWRLFTYIQNNLHITTADRLDERMLLQRNVLIVAVVPFVIALLGSLILLWCGLRRGLRPLERLRRALSYRDPDTLTPVKIGNVPDELAPVIDNLNRLLLRTSDVLTREQRFTNDAAHELRTPLTAIKLQVQLASRLPSGQAKEAISCAETGIARLQRTLEQLLMLARVEADQTSDDSARANSESIVDAALADLRDHKRVIVDHDSQPAILEIPHELAAAALRNLLQNSLQHTPNNAPITLDVRTEHAKTLFTVCDRGDWPPGQSTEFLTQRFWRHDSTQNGAHGSGLGLAIVAAIVKRYGGGVNFKAREDGGLVAHLWLPSNNQSAC